MYLVPHACQGQKSLPLRVGEGKRITPFIGYLDSKGSYHENHDHGPHKSAPWAKKDDKAAGYVFLTEAIGIFVSK